MKQSMQVLTSSKTVEWYTPPLYTEAARRAMGSIDLDPASTSQANTWIKAKEFYTVDDDGLSKPWHGNIWLNPPYGKTGNRSNQDIWSYYAIEQYAMWNLTQAIILTKTVPGYVWWEWLFGRYPVCMCRERIAFWKIENGKVVVKGRAKAGTSFWYVGTNRERFRDEFYKFGRVIMPETVI